MRAACSLACVLLLGSKRRREGTAFVPPVIIGPQTSIAARICAPAPILGSLRRRDRSFARVQQAAQAEARAPSQESLRSATVGPRPLDGREGVNLYFAEFNFCLDPRDSALAGPTMTKTLNRLTNEVVKNILILNSPEDALPAGKQLEALRQRFADESESDSSLTVPSGLDYLDCVVSLGLERGCPAKERLEALEPRFHRAFCRVARVLRDFGCVISEGVPGRVSPKDKDICLSVLDYAAAGLETRTRVLNAIANRVCRTMCVGNDDDLAALAREMEAKREKLLAKWMGDRWRETQEDRFYQGLMRLLQQGFADPPPGLDGPYSNAYKRLVDVLVQEVGTGATPASDKVLDSFVRWERDLRKNITEPAWDANPADLVGSWALGDDFSQAGLGLEPDYFDGNADLYASFKARKPSSSSGGSSSSGSGSGGSGRSGGALRKELVVTFRADGGVTVSPEAGVGLRWRLEPGPTHLDTVHFEMLSTTESDAAAAAAVAAAAAQGLPAPRSQSAKAGKAVSGLPGGSSQGLLRGNEAEAASGLADGAGILLSYTGYVDRGARIEARFSKRPVKMTGRLTRVVRGVARPSTRFSMRLVQRAS